MYLPIAGHHPYRSPGPAIRPRPFGEQTELDCYRNDLSSPASASWSLVTSIYR